MQVARLFIKFTVSSIAIKRGLRIVCLISVRCRAVVSVTCYMIFGTPASRKISGLAKANCVWLLVPVKCISIQMCSMLSYIYIYIYILYEHVKDKINPNLFHSSYCMAQQPFTWCCVLYPKACWPVLPQDLERFVLKLAEGAL
jgi:hypothetical protein